MTKNSTVILLPWASVLRVKLLCQESGIETGPAADPECDVSTHVTLNDSLLLLLYRNAHLAALDPLFCTAVSPCVGRRLLVTGRDDSKQPNKLALPWKTAK